MGGSRSRVVGAHGGLTVYTWMFGIFVIYRKGMRWRTNSKGVSRLQMIKGTKFFSGVSFLTFVKTFAIHESVSLGKLFMIFSIIIFFPLIQWNFWLYSLPHYWSGQMKHWRQCLYPRAPEPADCAVVLGFLHKIRPCTEDFWRYPTSRTR